MHFQVTHGVWKKNVPRLVGAKEAQNVFNTPGKWMLLALPNLSAKIGEVVRKMNGERKLQPSPIEKTGHWSERKPPWLCYSYSRENLQECTLIFQFPMYFSNNVPGKQIYQVTRL